MAEEQKQLFPVIDVPDFAAYEERYDRKYHPSVRWDLAKGDFVRDGANRMVSADGLEAYRIWCVKTVQTERYACLAYNSDIGSEMEKAMKEPDEKAVESAVERTITEALMANPRTAAVEGFSFTWLSGDSLLVEFTVRSAEDDKFRISVTI